MNECLSIPQCKCVSFWVPNKQNGEIEKAREREREREGGEGKE